MKKAIIIHCWGGNPNYCWYPYLKKELEIRDFEVLVPEMPDTDQPKLTKWLSKLQKIAGKPDKNLYLIGHSAGCITILRYLESLKAREKVGGVVLIAGFSDDLGYKELTNFFKKPLDYQKIRSHCNKFVAIHSDNDPYVDLKYGQEFKEKLEAKLIIKHNLGHFSGPIDDEKSCIELPDALMVVLEMDP